MDNSILYSKPEDEGFHLSRIMFCVKDGEVKVCGQTASSHAEWFEKMGWANKEDMDEFVESNLRGSYFPGSNSLYAYKGAGFGFNEEIEKELITNLLKIKGALDLNNETEIHLGPKDENIGGKMWPKKYLGKLKDLRKIYIL